MHMLCPHHHQTICIYLQTFWVSFKISKGESHAITLISWKIEIKTALAAVDKLSPMD